MKHIKSIREFRSLFESNNNNDMETTVTFLASVDDYEHDGDTENEVRKWKSLGTKTKIIKSEYPEDDPSPLIEVTIKLSSSIAKNLIDKAKSSLERASRTGDYSTAVYAWDIEMIFSESDKQNRTSFNEVFSKEIKELEALN